MVTIKDIANKAGVSFATVSRALSGSAQVSDKTRKKIAQIADELEYRPNAIARSLVTKKTNTIAILIPDISNPFFAELAQAISRRSEEAGYTTIISSTDWNPAKEREKLEYMVEKRVDGIILKPSKHDLGTFVNNLNTPLVLIAELSESDCSQVEVDNVAGGFLATEHLIKQGYRDIYFMCGVESSYTANMRISGYRKALLRYGLPFKESNLSWGDYSIESGYKRMSELLKEDFAHDSVFCGSDTIAIGVIKSLTEHGIKVPDDIGVVGYDNLSLSALPQIMLTTVSQPMVDIGDEAVALLLKTIELNDENYIRKLLLMPSLVVRNTTRER